MGILIAIRVQKGNKVPVDPHNVLVLFGRILLELSDDAVNLVEAGGRCYPLSGMDALKTNNFDY